MDSSKHCSPSVAVNAASTHAIGGESAAHRELKRLALVWAQARGFRFAAAEVSLPTHRYRLDVAACRMEHPRTLGTKDAAAASMIGATAIFECKASRTDFRRDARCLAETVSRLKVLNERKVRIEEELRLYYPSIRNGDSLFPEYETLDFRRPGYERYERVVAQISRLSVRLHANTKFDRLAEWDVANLRYVVAEPAVVDLHELPPGWGLLVRESDKLEVVVRPILRSVTEGQRMALFQRIALAATRAVNAAHSVTFDDIAAVGGQPSSRK